MKEGDAISILRAVLTAVRTAAPGTDLDDIARDLGLHRDELAAMIDYWVHRGELTLDTLGGCPPAGCTGCPAGRGRTGCPQPSTPGGAHLIAIRPRRDTAG